MLCRNDLADPGGRPGLASRPWQRLRTATRPFFFCNFRRSYRSATSVALKLTPQVVSMSDGEPARASLSRKMSALQQVCRYKVFYGGRGAGKSHGVALWLLAKAGEETLRVLCCREFQSSIRESVHKLLSDRIIELGLQDKFEIQQSAIRGLNGSEFLFEGLKHNISRIRSLEGIDRVWVEEAQNVSRSSWEVLIPTIRKEGSEIIITFNPELETDETYQRFVVNPPPGAVVVKTDYPDNPWFPDVLRQEMEQLKLRDPDAYQHVWLGQCRYTLDGAIYARELREAQEAGRIRPIVPDPTMPVSVYLDLGWADNTSIWFVQHIAGEIRLIDFEQDAQRPFNHYLRLLQQKAYTYHTMWLPHDAEARSLGTGRSVEELARAAGWRVRIVPRLSVADGINATRTLFPTMYFDLAKCADGLQSLRHYRYGVDDGGRFSRTPLHDDASHAADALRYVCVAMSEARPSAAWGKRRAPPRLYGPRESLGLGWLRS